MSMGREQGAWLRVQEAGFRVPGADQVVNSGETQGGSRGRAAGEIFGWP